MNKKVFFTVFAIVVMAIVASFILKISAVTGPVDAIFGAMKNPYLAGSAVLLSMLFNRHKHYWLLMIVSAFIVALIVQVFVMGGHLMIVPVVYKVGAFVAYAYLLKLIRFML